MKFAAHTVVATCFTALTAPSRRPTPPRNPSAADSRGASPPPDGSGEEGRESGREAVEACLLSVSQRLPGRSAAAD